jgi:hypothetical protein
MAEEGAAADVTITTATDIDSIPPANSNDQPTSRKPSETTPSNSATSTAVSSFWSGKPSKSNSSSKEKQKSVVNLVIGDSDELTDQSDDNEDHADEEERSEVSKDLKEEDDENEYREILKKKSMCQNCERDGRTNCVLAPRIGRYPRCVRCRDKDWRCSFLPVKNGGESFIDTCHLRTTNIQWYRVCTLSQESIPLEIQRPFSQYGLPPSFF